MLTYESQHFFTLADADCTYTNTDEMDTSFMKRTIA